MKIVPSIDLWDGRAVCLPREDGAPMTVCSAQGCGVARRFIRAGARYLHIMDLQGAAAGEPDFANYIEIGALLQQGHACIQIAGGIRTEEHILKYLEMGADRVVMDDGSEENLPFIRRMARRYGGKLAVAVELKDGETCAEACRRLQEAGVEAVVCSADRKAGLSAEILDACRKLGAIRGLEVTVAVSIVSAEEIRLLKETGVAGVIPGVALYERLDLGMCLEAAENRGEPEDDEMPLF